jgi:hypothetical protein
MDPRRHCALCGVYEGPNDPLEVVVERDGADERTILVCYECVEAEFGPAD